jgi:DNA modification methylase
MQVHCAHDKLVPVSELKPHPKNRNKHPPEQIDRLAAILRYQGFRYPIKVSNRSGFITSGHGRLEAAQLNGWDAVPVNYQDYESDEQEYADVQSDNAIASWSELDLSGINTDLGDLGPDFDIDLLGIRDFVLEPVEKLEPGCDEDEAPEPPAEPKTKLGDVYRLGRHRLMCGDSTSIDAVEKLMDGQKADFCFTSPPYNSAMKGGGRMGANEGKGFYADGYTDDRSSEEYVDFNRQIFAAMFAASSDQFSCCYNINYNKNSPSEYLDVALAGRECFPLVETIVWEKAMAISLQGDNLTRIYEFIFVYAKNGLKMNKEQTECERNLWKISNIGANHETHKACFPVELAQKGVELFAPPNGNVVEPFGGSGTTLIACEKTGRSAYLMELDPRYCDVIVARWEKFTGKKAELINGTS